LSRKKSLSPFFLPFAQNSTYQIGLFTAFFTDIQKSVQKKEKKPPPKY